MGARSKDRTTLPEGRKDMESTARYTPAELLEALEAIAATVSA